MDSLKESLQNGEYEAQLFETASYCLFQESELQVYQPYSLIFCVHAIYTSVIVVKELTLKDIRKATNKLLEKLVSKCGTAEEISKSETLIQQLRIKYEESVNTYFKDLEVNILSDCTPN